MLRKTLPVLAMVLVFAVIAFGQGTPKEQLQQQLITQEEAQELLGSSWITDSISELENVPSGVANVVGTFKDNSNSEILVVILISFENPEATGLFIEALSGDKKVTNLRNLREEAETNAELLPERILEESQEIVLLELDNGLHQLMIRRGNLLYMLRSSQTGPINLEKLIEVADKQLEKTLTFCEEFQGENKPAYCTL